MIRSKGIREPPAIGISRALHSLLGRRSCLRLPLEYDLQEVIDAMSEPRVRKPRPPVVVRASFVSQDSSPALLGLSARKFLEVLVPRCRKDSIRVGRTILIPLDVAEAALRAIPTSPEGTPDVAASEAIAEPTSVEAVLASVGMRRRAAR